MSIYVSDAHQWMSAFCKDRIGIGIADSIFNYVFRQAVAANPGSFVILSKHQFLQMPLSFAVTIDASNSAVQLGNGKTGGVGLIIQNLIARVEILIGVKPTRMAAVEIVIQDMLAQFILQPGTTAFGFDTTETPTYTIQAVSEDWQNYTDLEGTPFGQIEKDDWKVEQRALMLGAPEMLGAAFAQSMDFPNILDVFTPLKLSLNSIEMAVINNMLVVAGEGLFDLNQCPYLPTVPPRTDGVKEDAMLVDRSKLPDVHVPGNDVEFPGGGLDALNAASLFLYTPIKLLELSFDGVLKPAIYASDGWHFGPIFARYSLTVALQHLLIQLTALSPAVTFQIISDLVAHGDASAGIKLGKLKWEFSARVDADVHSEISFTIRFDPTTLIVHFTARFDGATVSNFRFSGLGYPLDQVASALGGRAIQRMISDQAGAVLAKASVPIADLKKLRGFATPVNSIASDGDATAATLGLEFRL